MIKRQFYSKYVELNIGWFGNHFLVVFPKRLWSHWKQYAEFLSNGSNSKDPISAQASLPPLTSKRANRLHNIFKSNQKYQKVQYCLITFTRLSDNQGPIR
jgi:hypothetical protein